MNEEQKNAMKCYMKKLERLEKHKLEEPNMSKYWDEDIQRCKENIAELAIEIYKKEMTKDKKYYIDFINECIKDYVGESPLKYRCYSNIYLEKEITIEFTQNNYSFSHSIEICNLKLMDFENINALVRQLLTEFVERIKRKTGDKYNKIIRECYKGKKFED